MATRTTRRRARRRAGARRALAPKPPPLAVALRRACEDLAAVGVSFALVGGLAVSARAEPRLTRDVDFAVRVEDDSAAEHLVRALAARGYRVGALVEHEAAKRLATIRLRTPDGRLVVDLLVASCGIEDEIVRAAQRLEILPGLRVPVARTGHLIAMKLLAMDDRQRPQDYDDVLALLAVASAGERRRVGVAVAEIAARGFARRRDLPAAWRRMLAIAVRSRRALR